MFPPRKSHRKETRARRKPRPGLVFKKIAVQWRCVHTFADASDKLRQSAACRVEKRIKVVKCSSVSTGQLKRLLALHNQPINLVVFQGTLGPKSNET